MLRISLRHVLFANRTKTLLRKRMVSSNPYLLLHRCRRSLSGLYDSSIKLIWSHHHIGHVGHLGPSNQVYAYFLALPSHFSASDCSTRFLAKICRLHGIPKSIVSDRDPIFLSKFWQELFKTQDTTLKYCIPIGHTKIDG